MSETLKKGEDSGNVPERVKLQVFVSGIGICAAPNCSERIVQDRTRLGECAHIIPRRVGSHPREDYATPLDDRSKEHNLLYLCEKHHKIVDDPQHAGLYTADVLREWKTNHEAWAAGVKKNSPNLPQNVQDVLSGIEKQIAEQANVSEDIISALIDNCRGLLDRQLINEARVFLSQIDLLLLGASNSSLNAKADLLAAILLIRDEQIQEAKRHLLQIIQDNPHDIEVMLEYIDLCDSAPESDDNSERIEQLVRELAGDHLRFLLLDLVRKLRSSPGDIELPDISSFMSDDARLNARFYCQYALFHDRARRTDQRDNFINRWESELPSSPRPHLFRALFREFDLLRTSEVSSVGRIGLAQQALSYSRCERNNVENKDPLTVRDQITWLMQEIRLELISFSGKDLKKSREDIVSLITYCYFDSFIDHALREFLTNIRIEPDQWRTITRRILESKTSPSEKVIESLFFQALQYDDLYADLDSFVYAYDRRDLSVILHAIEEGDVEGTAERVNAKNDPMFTLHFLRSTGDYESAVQIADLLEIDDEHQVDLLYTQLVVFSLNDRDDKALELISNFPLDDAAPHVLHTIARIAFRNKQWHLFIPPGIQLLDFDMSLSGKSQLHAELATAFFNQGDHSNAVIHAEYALGQSEVLGEENSQNILYALAQSLVMKGQPDEACKKYQQYEHVKRSFSLLLEEADAYLKSTFADKYEKAQALILRAFEEAEVYDDKLYVAPLMSLIELTNVGMISIEDESLVEDKLFVKLNGFPDGWFYIGDCGNSLGAECIKPGTPNYGAVIHETISDEIDWPADRFSDRKSKRRIIHIASAPAFLSHRAHEAMQHIAEKGNAPIWSIQVTQEDGLLNIENMQRFFEQFDDVKELFDNYISDPMPFSFLCKMLGGLAEALGKIASERKGFIRCNDGTQADIEQQKAAASDVLQETDFFMDGLSALMLAEAGLLEVFIATFPNIGVSTSVIRLLREIARQFETTSSRGGWARFVDGKFQFSPRDKEQDDAFREQLLWSAELLDQLPNKVIARNYPELHEDLDLDHFMPDYFVDAFRYAQEKEAHLMADDALLVQAYKLFGESPIPKHFSSISLVRLMADNGLLRWDDYLKYFALLTFYRYHFLPISIDDLIQTVFPPARAGLVTSSPRNILLLNLRLTLSPEYGVDDKTATRVIAFFFTKIIQDDTVPSEIADEIFALTIGQGLAQRDRKLTARVLLQICRQNVLDKDWVSQRRSKAKLEILERQLLGFAQGLDPIVVEASSMLRMTDYTRV